MGVEPRPDTSRKGSPFSIRLSRATDQLVSAEARRTRRSRSAVVEAFTEETARTRRFPGIGWEIVHMLDDFGTVRRLVAQTHLTENQVRLALAYRDEYPDDVDEAIEENRRPLGELETLYPFIRVARSGA